ncbi:unnamed protein product [Schistosoma intercalatum]|nr:unnamed protein product [Schistosoma intercalatum]
MQPINNIVSEHISTGSSCYKLDPLPEFHSKEISIKRSPDPYPNEFCSLNPQHDDDLYKSVRSLSELEENSIHSPEETLLLTNVNGFWKQENIKWSSNSPKFSPPTSPSFSYQSISSDCLSDEPEQKPQPFLRSHHDSSSEEVSRDDEVKEDIKSVRPTFMRHMQFPTKIRSQWKQSFNKSHIVRSSLTSTARKKALLAKAVSRKVMYSQLSKSTSVQLNQEPWQVGELVWARPNWPENLPWWPAIVTEKPKKYQAKGYGLKFTNDFNNETVPTFRVCLLGIIRPLSFLTLPQTRLRLFSGREEFESFLRQTVLEAKDKVRALRQFTVHPSLQSAWHRAREAAVAAKLTKPAPTDRLALFPWATEPSFRKLDPLSEFVRKNTGKFTLYSKSRKRPYRDETSEGGSFLSSSSDDSDTSVASDTDIDSKGKHHRPSSYISSSTSTSSIGHRKRLKLSNDSSKNEKTGQRWIDLANSFEFEKLRFGHTTPKHHFMCSVCGEFNNNTSVTINSHSTVNTAQPILSDVAHTTQLDSQRNCNQVSQQHLDKLDSVIMPCVGYCGNYLHLNCAPYIFYRSIKQKIPDHNGTDDSNHQVITTMSNNIKDIKCSMTKDLTVTSVINNDSLQPNPVCNLCLAGLRQCFICYLTHPDPHLLTLQGSSCSETPSVDHAISDSSVVDKNISEVNIKIEDGVTDNNSHQKDIQLISEPSKSDVPRSGDQMIRCSVRACRRWYHPSCLRKPPFAVVVREGRSGSFTCPAHTCLACSAETPGTMPRPSPHFIRCVMCPAAYHPGDWCLPAGSKEIAPNLIICPRHALQDECKLYNSPPNIQLKLPSSGLLNMFRPTNVSWCFICSKGGRIICCENCPASFHEECLKIDEVPDKFICEDCTNGRMLRYGEIVWARLPPSLQLYHQRSLKLSGVYSSHRLSPFNLSGTIRPNDYASLTAGMYWWPGELVHPRHLQTSQCHVQSENKAVTINFQPTTSPTSHSFNHILGSVLVRLFGLTGRLSHRHSRPVYLWTTRARLFPYEEGDDKRGSHSTSSDDDDSTEPEREGDVTHKKYHTKQRPNRNRRHNDCDDDDGEDEDPLLELNSSNLLIEENNNNNSSKSINTSCNENSNPMESPTGSIYKSSSRLSRNLCLRPRANNCLIDENSVNSTPNPRTPPSVVRRKKFIYNAALKQAARGYLKRHEKFSELLGRTRRPDYYKPIKVNWPLGSVRVYRLTDSSEAPRCECKPNSEDPCGPSSNCINRELHYECLPSICPNGDACRNQRFTKRLYPPQRPFWTGDQRGWGLKTMVAIRAGEFVNEYIGDLIDEDEANRRLRFAHENNITNYYMMKLDSQRIIDAGPKGNLSRFMNHSCDPNLNTQKWTVNGDNRIGLFAVRDISAGEELTFNYNFVALGQERLNCRCGASNCVGFLGARSESSSNNNGSGQVGGNSSSNFGESNNPSNALINTDISRGSSKRHTVQTNPRSNDIDKCHMKDGRDICSSKVSNHNLSTTSLMNNNKNGSTNVNSPLNRRHETKCFRCGEKDAPIGNRSLSLFSETLSLTNSSHTNTTIVPSSSLSSNKSLSKRGLKRELEDLVASVVNHSPSKSQHGLSSPTLISRNETQSSVFISTTNATTTEDRTSYKSPDLILCSKHDCSKAYHLFCLDLDTPPQGQWFCPWHHCDACGRPSHIFCSICPSSFCLAHVEGSIVVLPPVLPKRNRKLPNNRPENNVVDPIENRKLYSLLARIVCMFHHDLINNVYDRPVVKKKKLNPLVSSTSSKSDKCEKNVCTETLQEDHLDVSNSYSSGLMMTRRQSLLRQSTMSQAEHCNDISTPNNNDNNSTSSCGLETTKQNDCLSNCVSTTPNRTIETN